MSLTSALMIPIAFVGFVGTLIVGYMLTPMMTTWESVLLVSIASAVSVISEIGFAGLSIFVWEVVLG